MSIRAAIELTLGALHLDAAIEVSSGAVAIVGPNGAGKTTLLRALAGLLPLDAGRVEIAGVVVDDPAAGIWLAPEERRVGVVFQEHRLFANLTALENVAFGLRARGVDRDRARAQAMEWLDRIGLSEVAARKPSALSSGQAQRVALARALVTEPAVLLLDEPLASVDAAARVELRRVIRDELRRYDGAQVIVTHDPLEAAALADRLVVLEDGRVTQDGPLATVTAQPRSAWVASMVGLNLFQGTAHGTTVSLAAGSEITTAEAREGAVFAAFRPNAVVLSRSAPSGSARNAWGGTAGDLHMIGDRARVTVVGALAGTLVAEVTAASVAALDLAGGGPVWAAVKATDIDVYPA